MRDRFEDLEPEYQVTRTELLKTTGRIAVGLSGAALIAGHRADGVRAAQRATPPGTVVFGMEANPPGFDPAKWWSNESFSGTLVVFDRLLNLNPYTGALEPALAVGAPTISRNGTRYTFRLRQGVKFHHGRELTADDVKFSLERLMAPATAAEAGSLYQSLPITGLDSLLKERSETVSGIRVADPYTVVIDLDRADSSLLPYLTYLPASIVPRDVVKSLGAKKFNWAPVGTGSYRMTNIRPGQGVELVRNGQYWGKRPRNARVVWKIGISPDLSILRIQRGEQDLMFEQVPSATLPSLRGNADLADQIRTSVVNEVRFVGLSEKHPALSRLPVRKAIASAIDKRRIVSLLRGAGQPATGGLFAPPSPYYQKGLGYTLDIQRAKNLLADAGFANGFEVEIASNGETPSKEIATGIQQDLAAIGIRVKIRELQTRGGGDEYNNFGPLISQNAWDGPVPTGAYLMDAAFTKAAVKQGCCNYSNWTSSKMERLVKQAHLSSAPKARNLYKQMDRLVTRDETWWVPILYPIRSDFTSARVRGFKQVKFPNIALKVFGDISTG